jgi:hypothetical protein
MLDLETAVIKQRRKTALSQLAQSYDRSRRLMRRVFKVSLMSDTKWRKLFWAIKRLDLQLPLCRVKWIDSDMKRVILILTGAFLYTPRPFVDFAEFGPYELSYRRETGWAVATAQHMSKTWSVLSRLLSWWLVSPWNYATVGYGSSGISANRRRNS